MKTRVIASILIVSLLLVALSGNVAGAYESELFENNAPPIEINKAFVDGEFLVKFTARASDKAIEELSTKHGCRVRYASPLAGFRILEVPPGRTVSEMVKVYSRVPMVEYAQPNYICYADMTPNDSYYSYQWNLQMINMESAWDIVPGGDANVIVAVLDSGVAYEDYQEFIDNPGRGQDYWEIYQQAPDLALTNFVPGYDFINNDEHPNDDDSHGTHVTGTIAQSTNNSYGVAGVAFNTSIMPVKVLDRGGGGTAASLADGIYYAANHGADIINMSLGFPPSVTEAGIPAVTEAVAYAYNNGVIQVASSGNDGIGVVSLPAAYDQVIAVGAVNSADERASYSQYGTGLEVVAPGGDDVDRDGDGYADGILQQTINPNTRDTTDFGFWFFSGTSMAAPHTSGLIALLLAQDNSRTLSEIRDILHSTSVDLGDSGWDAAYGYGRIDALAALTYTGDPNQPLVAAAGLDQEAVVGQEVTFNGSNSSGAITTYSWDFGDGVTGSGVIATHAYAAAGTYTVTLTVADDGGLTDTDTATVTVSPVSGSAMHVAGIDVTYTTKRAGKNTFYFATAEVCVVDAYDEQVPGVTVYGHWTGLTSDFDTGITDTFGIVSLMSDSVKNPSGGEFVFWVDDLVKSGWTYDKGENDETSDSVMVP